MNNVWFSQEMAPYFSLLSLLALLGLFKVWAEKGRYRSAVTAISIGIIVLGAGLLAASVVGHTVGQPVHVVKSLAVSGGLIIFLFAGFLGAIRKAYGEADLRRTMARDL